MSPFTGSYWFITVYLLLMVISPYLDIIIKRLEESLRIYQRLIILLTLIVPVYGTIYLSNITCSDIVIAIYWYLLVGYLKRVPNNIITRHAKLMLAMFSVVFLECCASILSTKLGITTIGIENLIGRFSIF